MTDDALDHPATDGLTVSLLADSPGSLRAVADMRWREWGHAPESDDPAWWFDITAREAGRERLPVTFVAHDADNEVVGAAGLDVYDLDERRESSPWVTGVIVRSDRRLRGVGRHLMHHLEHWAAQHGIAEAWVGTDLAREFYGRCGWTAIEAFVTAAEEHMTVLHKNLVGR